MKMAATMWDDGLVTDLRLLEILRRLGLTATFALSPSRYKTTRSVNDCRGDYGELVSLAELKEYADFEICNHGNTHADLGKLTPAETEMEITDGRRRLEDIFNRQIPGFCYPYGVHTETAIAVLRTQAKYARTTHRGPFHDPILMHTTGKWDINIDTVINLPGVLILWGHTYELRTDKDWYKLTRMYETLAECTKVVPFMELV